MCIRDSYSHVMHIVSNVQGRLRNDLSSIDALVAGFPAGTVTGAPKIRAMEIIEELETEKLYRKFKVDFEDFFYEETRIRKDFFEKWQEE